MAAEREAAALLNRRHDLQLAEAEVSPPVLSPSRPVGAEDIRDLQGIAWHDPVLRRSATLKGTQDFAQSLRGDMGIERRGLQFFMSKQHLDGADIFALFEQMGGEGVPQRMHRDALVDARSEGGLMHGAVQLPCAHGVHRIKARKQIAAREDLPLGVGMAPPGAQPLEQEWRQQRVAILLALALLDAQEHALTVNVPDFERDHFADA